MRKFFLALDKWIQRVCNWLAIVTLVLLVAVVIIQVIVRYVFHLSIGGFEELPVYLFLVSIWIIAVLNAKNKGNISIDFIYLIVKGPKSRAILNGIIDTLSTVILALFTKLSFDFLLYTFDNHSKTAGLMIPYALLATVVTVSTILSTVYNGVNAVKDFREVASK